MGKAWRPSCWPGKHCTKPDHIASHNKTEKILRQGLKTRNPSTEPALQELTCQRVEHAKGLCRGKLTDRLNLTLSEALVPRLLEQDVKVFFGVFGHGSIEAMLAAGFKPVDAKNWIAKTRQTRVSHNLYKEKCMQPKVSVEVCISTW